MNTNTQHPAKAFGDWLREKRRARNLVARVFSGAVWLSHAKYAELELGVIKWVSQKQELLIPLFLGLNKAEKAEFVAKLKAARSVKNLCFSDIFTRDELRPVRACHHNGKQITKEDEERILNAVFAPLS
ncbi:MAG TPA: hypothetical protein VIK53_05420 [Verrucomicrobiae bacterium]